MKPIWSRIKREVASYHGSFPWFVCMPIGLCIMLCGLFSCEYFKHQSQIDSRLEDIALKEAEGAEKAADASLDQDVKDRASKDQK